MAVTVKRLNVSLEIPDEDLERYLKLGYCQVDPKTFEVIQYGEPRDVESFRQYTNRLKKKISELEAENSKLVAENKKLKAKKTPKAPEKSGTIEE